ncbi:MAG: peptidoglycan DD-metalloendopeptidase family protein [Clostridiales bacterium]|jgi:murein DD-endopeptidase MepM/ murein hydrolase activator NlpD|nr:peptidoglycan DD-metalloendopeptidase family protein [Clostridiales bacterium]
MPNRIAAVIAAMSLLSVTVQASSSVSDLKDKQSTIQQEQKDAQEALGGTQAKKSQTEAEMEEADALLTEVSGNLIATIDRLDKTNARLASVEAELAEARQQRQEQYETLKERMRYMYMNGSINYFDVLFEATDFADFVNRVEYINRIVINDKTLVSKLEATEATIAEKTEEVEKQKSNIELLLLEQQRQQTELEAVMAEKQALYDKLDADEKTYQEKLDSLAKAEKEVQDLIIAANAAAEAKRKAAAAAASNSYASLTKNVSPYTGKMLWPVPGRYNISDVYRARRNPVNGKSEFHTGIDIPAPTGTSVVAADAGVVIYSGWKGGYGNTIIIDHGNGITTLYAHNSKLVASIGAIVNKGETVSRAGSTGNSTGPHCHFEVRINGSTTNPKAYLNY